jgi:hypothetical protein
VSVAEHRKRAEQAETERDALKVELERLRGELAKALTRVPLICSDERHEAKVKGLLTERDTLKAAKERAKALCGEQYMAAWELADDIRAALDGVENET